MRYAYALTAALLLGGTTATLALQSPAASQEAQNEPGLMASTAPRPGAPMSFADLAARLQPAVVNISTKQKVQVPTNNPFAGTPFADLFGGGEGRSVTREAQSLGSGFLISPDGYIVTNNHVVSPGQRGAAVSSITVTFPDRTEYSAKLVGRDAASDLAVLKIEGRNLPYVKFGDSSRTRVGDWVVAIGNPYGLGGTVTAGIVSALHRNIGSGPSDRYIQTDASINQGNSGGPMFDMSGNVIGINTAIFSPTGGNVGIGFAIPSEVAAPIIETLKSGGKVKRGYLGVSIQPLDEGAAEALGLPKNQGELIARVEPNEAAAKAGIREGDVVVRVGGRDVTPDQTLSFLIANQSVGSRVPIEVIRAGKRLTFTAVLGERPSEDRLAAIAGGNQGLDPEDEETAQNATRESLGLAVQELTPEIARQLGLTNPPRGVVVAAVDPASDAAAKGVRRGDIILSANQQPTLAAADLGRIATEAKRAGRTNVLLYIQRGSMPPRYLAVKFR
ncbi:MAG: Do family serine endopeptidase [Sphingomonadaceae bacterium]|nr:Do family serine endopeptidase [Sphingomonadaceae bacterium]NBU77509.1 Do family serine endopeptidase [Sphingomonadaceae bacterium]NCA02210.1 Do family serine endopeptidase [Sphingomonadaceae bacterium]